MSDFNQPLGGNTMPRFAGPATMMRPRKRVPKGWMRLLSVYPWISVRRTARVRA